jgi:hypothetical protein
VKYLFALLIFFVVRFCFANPQSSGLRTLRLVSSTVSDSTSVRKSVFRIKGRPVDRQVYFEYLKCKKYKGSIVGSSIFMGVGVVALAGSIPLFLRTDNFTGNGIYYGSGGVVLANIAGVCLGWGIPLTISNVKFYRKTKCKELQVNILPAMTGVGVMCRF